MIAIAVVRRTTWGISRHLPCPENSVERIETYHVIEHLPHPVVRSGLEHWYRLLTPGGKLILECPDLDKALREYLDGNEERLFNIFGRQRFPGDAHLFGYNASRLCKLLESVGFTEVVQREPRDYHKELEPCLRVECEKPCSHGRLADTDSQQAARH